MNFWAELDAELERFPARPLIERHPGMCTRAFTGYRVWFSGLDGHRLFGFLSVPNGDGPFPGKLETPRHGSVNNPPHYNDRCRYVVLTMMHRGQRLADVPFRAEYPGLFSLGVIDPRSFVYRAIIADCLRAAEVLFTREELDTERLGVSGEDLALCVFGLRPWFRAALVWQPLLHDAMRRRLGTDAYPLEELNDWLRARPEDESAMAETFAHYEPTRIARAAAGEILLAEPASGPGWNAELLAELGQRCTRYQRTGRDAADVTRMDTWLAERLGVPGMARFRA